MQIGKPTRRFIVRVVELETGKSRNFSIYGKQKFKRIQEAVRTALENMDDRE